MGILDLLLRLTPQGAYDLGFDDGKNGSSRRILYTKGSDFWTNIQEKYNQGYEDGRQERYIDKLSDR